MSLTQEQKEKKLKPAWLVELLNDQKEAEEKEMMLMLAKVQVYLKEIESMKMKVGLPFETVEWFPLISQDIY